MAPVKDAIWQYVIDGSAEPDDTENFSALGNEEDTSDYDDAFCSVLCWYWFCCGKFFRHSAESILS